MSNAPMTKDCRHSRQQIAEPRLRYSNIRFYFVIRHSGFVIGKDNLMDQQPTSSSAVSGSSSSVRTWCILAHATALVGFLVPVAGHIVGPLIVWLAKRRDSPEIDAHGKESMNFQISMLIWNAIAAILIIVLIGIPILILLHILNIIFVIVASIQASEGKLYRYPLAIRLIN
jgi:uncharacterized Tic20 family protein